MTEEKIIFSQEELEEKQHPKRKRKPERIRIRELDAEKMHVREMRVAVCKKTGFRLEDVKTILDAGFEVIREQILSKKPILISGIGSLNPSIRASARKTFFAEPADKKPVQKLTQPMYTVKFYPLRKLAEEMKDLPISREEIENVYAK